MKTAGHVLLILTLFSARLSGAEEVDYVRDIKPVLKERCFACHGVLKQESGLRMDAAALIRQGGESGAVIAPGQSAASLLIEKVAASDLSERMPPEGKPLTDKQIALLKTWIDQGAVAPDDDRPEEDPRQHWAFQRPVRVALPAHDADANPIDVLIELQRSQRGLKAVGQIDQRLLLRRVYLDLIGLPPTREELNAFLADPSDKAYEKVVDRLLASPHYGERWGRHWMDIWRYTDWYGLGEQLRYSQKHIWHWRDWIVESLNADKGYDQMIREMLAADELTPTDHDALRATGFLARNYFLFNRTTWLDNTIEHTSKAFFGLTMECTKCHDHKFDPITQLDYYRLRAFFEPQQVRLDAWPGEIDLEKNGLPRVYDAHPDAPTYVHIRGDEKNPDKNNVVTPAVPAILSFDVAPIAPVALSPEAHNPALQAFVRDDHLRAAAQQIESARQSLEAARKQLADAGAQAQPADKSAAMQSAVSVAEKSLAAALLRPAAIEAALAADRAKQVESEAATVERLIGAAALAARQFELAKADEALAIAEQKLLAADEKTKASAEAARQTARANVEKAQQAVANPGRNYSSIAATLKALEGPDESDATRRLPYPNASTGRRTALASWIASEKNPLTARVAVNHIWTRHFGQPLVESMTDFGRRSPRPPLHDVLDWLAVEFMSPSSPEPAAGNNSPAWSMKHLHRLIVTSRTYRLSTSTASADESTRQADPENHFYWRRRPQRMESQVIRDSLLQLAGVLDPTLGGPTINPKQDDTVFRRSLYFTHSMDDEHAFLAMFDNADILRCYRRQESIVPQQALALANSKLALTMSRKLAANLQSVAGEDDFIRAAFELILAVEPTEEEITACRDALARTKTKLVSASDDQRTIRARENLIHALLNHNDFITIR